MHWKNSLFNETETMSLLVKGNNRPLIEVCVYNRRISQRIESGIQEIIACCIDQNMRIVIPRMWEI